MKIEKERRRRRKKGRKDLLCFFFLSFFYSHNRYDFTEAQSDPVHLGDEYACHGHEQRRPVHVNIATDRQNESGHSRIDSKFVRHQAESDGKCGSPVQNCIRENRGKRGRVESRL